MYPRLLDVYREKTSLEIASVARHHRGTSVRRRPSDCRCLQSVVGLDSLPFKPRINPTHLRSRARADVGGPVSIWTLHVHISAGIDLTGRNDLRGNRNTVNGTDVILSR